MKKRDNKRNYEAEAVPKANHLKKRFYQKELEVPLDGISGIPNKGWVGFNKEIQQVIFKK